MSNPQNDTPRHWVKPLVIVVVMATLAAVYFFNRDSLSLEALAARQDSIVAYQRQHPVLIFVIAYLLYTMVTGLTLPPGAAVLTLLYGWFLALVYGSTVGLFATMVLVSFASTSGATLAFLSSRYLVGDPIQRTFSEQLKKFNAALDSEGPFYLFTLRLIPAVPFFVINLVMGLTRIRLWTFWWVSQLGMLPGTFVFSLAGTRLPGPKEISQQGASELLSWDIWAAFALLAIFPFIVRAIMNRVRGKQGD